MSAKTFGSILKAPLPENINLALFVNNLSEFGNANYLIIR